MYRYNHIYALESYVGLCWISKKHQINHNNTIKTDNRLDNLTADTAIMNNNNPSTQLNRIAAGRPTLRLPYTVYTNEKLVSESTAELPTTMAATTTNSMLFTPFSWLDHNWKVPSKYRLPKTVVEALAEELNEENNSE